MHSSFIVHVIKAVFLELQYFYIMMLQHTSIKLILISLLSLSYKTWGKKLIRQMHISFIVKLYFWSWKHSCHGYSVRNFEPYLIGLCSTDWFIFYKIKFIHAYKDPANSVFCQTMYCFSLFSSIRKLSKHSIAVGNVGWPST